MCQVKKEKQRRNINTLNKHSNSNVWLFKQHDTHTVLHFAVNSSSLNEVVHHIQCHRCFYYLISDLYLVFQKVEFENSVLAMTTQYYLMILSSWQFDSHLFRKILIYQYQLCSIIMSFISLTRLMILYVPIFFLGWDNICHVQTITHFLGC